ncbi:MAG: signal peptidase II [Chryseolinea sp.]
MEARKLVRTSLIIIILAVNVSCDQISKSIVRERIEYHDQISLLRGHLTLMKVENTGAFLSAGNNLPQPIKLIFLGIIPLAAMAIALVYVFTKERLSVVRVAGICFLIGGGIGNIADRMIYGSVTDFLHLRLGVLQTGIFNLADVSIMTGIFLILFSAYITELFSSRRKDAVG